jgi:hypothetical protein
VAESVEEHQENLAQAVQLKQAVQAVQLKQVVGGAKQQVQWEVPAVQQVLGMEGE